MSFSHGAPFFYCLCFFCFFRPFRKSLFSHLNMEKLLALSTMQLMGGMVTTPL